MIRRFLLLSALLHAAALATWLPPARRPIPPALLAAELVGVPAPQLPVVAVPRPSIAPAPNIPATAMVPASRTAEIAARHAAAPSGDGGRDALANHLQWRMHGLLAEHFHYPPLARRNGWEGRVELLLALDHDGAIHALRVTRSSGYAILDEDALETVQRIGSRPEMRAELSGCDCELRVPVLYRLIEG